MFAAVVAHMGQTLEAFVGFPKLAWQPDAATKPSFAIVFGDEAAERAVAILDRLDQAERRSPRDVGGNVLESCSEGWRVPDAVAPRSLERDVNACDLIEVVEGHQRRRVVDERDAAGLEPAGPGSAGNQTEQLRFANQLELLHLEIVTFFPCNVFATVLAGKGS